MAIFGKDKPAGNTQPEAVQSEQKTESTMSEQIVPAALRGDALTGDAVIFSVRGAYQTEGRDWVTLKTNHTHAGVEYQAGARLLVSQSDVETLRYLGAID